MAGMNDSSHMHGVGAMNNGTGGGGGGMSMMPHRHMMMHMTFFWGKNAEILFSGWPGYDNLGMYVLALVIVFVLTVVVEWLSACKFIKESSNNNVAAGLVQTLMYGIRIGLAYMVMLAVMSFNAGVFLVAVAGHALGFFFFGSRAFNPSSGTGKTSDLPPLSC
ncbi:copper transporter 6-like [Coffea arabica]